MKNRTKIIGLSIISAILISGCVENSGTDGGTENRINEDAYTPIYKFENTVSSVKTNIIGTWNGDCIDTGDQFSKLTTKIFDNNNTYTSSISTFVGATCSNYDSNSSEIGNYTIGALTSDGDIEIDFNNFSNGKLLTLVHFIHDKLYIANNINDTREGVRETDFSKSQPLTKIK